MIICAGRNETFPFARPMGVGLVETAINLTQQCLFDKPDYLLFIGSAGSYGEHNIFDIIESRSASNIELSFLENNSYTPIDNAITSENKLCKNQTIVNTSNYISTNYELSQNFNKFGIGIENMEYFSVLRVAQEFDINVAGIFIVTNYTNDNAHNDFVKNHTKAKELLTKYLLDNKIIK